MKISNYSRVESGFQSCREGYGRPSIALLILAFTKLVMCRKRVSGRLGGAPLDCVSAMLSAACSEMAGGGVPCAIASAENEASRMLDTQRRRMSPQTAYQNVNS